MTSEKRKINTEISARVESLIKDAGETSYSFAKKLGYQRAQTIYDILNGKAAPSFDFFYKFMMSEYSAIYNIEWLLTGNGTMLKSKTPAPMGDHDSTRETAYKEMFEKSQVRIEELVAEKTRLEERLNAESERSFQPEAIIESLLPDAPSLVHELPVKSVPRSGKLKEPRQGK